MLGTACAPSGQGSGDRRLLGLQSPIPTRPMAHAFQDLRAAPTSQGCPRTFLLLSSACVCFLLPRLSLSPPITSEQPGQRGRGHGVPKAGQGLIRRQGGLRQEEAGEEHAGETTGSPSCQVCWTTGGCVSRSPARGLVRVRDGGLEDRGPILGQGSCLGTWRGSALLGLFPEVRCEV